MTDSTLRSVACALAIALGAVPAAGAQDSGEREIVLVCDQTDCARIDLDRVRARVAAETGLEVHRASEPSAQGATLHIRLEGDLRVALVLARPDGSHMERVADLPNDASERAETLAILAVNMFRDESAELLALLRPTPSEAGRAAAEPPGESVSEGEHESESESDGDGDGDSASAGPPIPTPAPSRDPFLRLGLAGALGSVPRAGGAAIDFIAGLEISWTPLPYFAVGLRDVGGGSTVRGSASHVDSSPFAELGLVLSFVSLYADLGAHVQLVFDGLHDGVSGVGVAPFVVLGIRFRLAPEVSLGVETALRVVATDSFFTGAYQLPQLAVPWTGGLALLFHIS